MRSPTQQDLTVDVVADLVRGALGTTVSGASELSGGGFATVWQVTLSDGRRTVLKVGPPPGARLLTYEHGLVDAEATYFRTVRERVPSVPVPEVLHHGDGWLLTTLLPGRTLADLRGTDVDDAPVRAGLGAAVAAVHTITGSRFGYDGPRPAAGTWPAAFTAIIEALLDDAAAWDVALPGGPAAVRAALSAHASILARVTTPALLHFDLWDGNVLAARTSNGSPALTGLVDGERHLWGDPLLDLVSPALFRRIEDEPDHPFVRGYSRVAGPVVFDESARIRLSLYRMHLYLLMLTEGPSRGLAADVARSASLTGLLRDELTALQVR